MPKLTANQRQSFRLFERRQQIYEKRYQKHFYAYLRKTYLAAARYYEENGRFIFSEVNDAEHLLKIFNRLYYQITLNEAKNY